jgi:UV DNA damage repair endonuclease
MLFLPKRSGGAGVRRLPADRTFSTPSFPRWGLCCQFIREPIRFRTTTAAALGTWPREPLFQISSPRDGWRKPHPERHHDFINPRDFPACWRDRRLTVEVEAKAKELADLKLRDAMERA